MDSIESLLIYKSFDEILNEAYKGKSKELLELEKMIGENRKKYYKTFKVGGGYYTDKDFIKIGDKIAKIFNFKVVDFNLVNDPSLNAFTIPAGFSTAANTSLANSIVSSDKDNMKFKHKNLSSVIRVTSGLWTNKEFTDSEITAIIIHEIGHNFQHEVNSGLKMYATCMFFLNIFQTITMICSGIYLPNAIINFIKSDSELRASFNDFAKKNGIGNIINIAGGILGFIKIIVYEVLELFGRITLGIPAGMINMSNIILTATSNPISVLVAIALTPIKKGGENVSDTWAAEHGYGAELISALAKMDIDPEASSTAVGRVSKKLPLFDSICTLFAMPLMIVSSLFEDHPVTGKRASNIVYELEKDLNNSDVSPAMKKEIQEDIKNVKKAIDKYSKIDSPLEGVALRKALLKFQTDFDKDPKGFFTRNFSSKDLIEAFIDEDAYEFLESSNENINLNDFL